MPQPDRRVFFPQCPTAPLGVGAGASGNQTTPNRLAHTRAFGYYVFLILTKMGRIDEFVINKIREAASIVDVVSDYVDLRKSGTGYVGLCPFHADRSIGSFQVSPSKNICKCFSCGRSADPVGFIMAMENLDFPDAIRWLGKKYSIEVDEEQKRFANVRPSVPRKEQPIPDNLPPRLWPIEWIPAFRKLIEEDALVKWIRSLPWDGAQRKRIGIMLRNYGVGHSRFTTRYNDREVQHDFTVWWMVDGEGRCHNAHLMKYGDDGHRLKNKDDYSQTWIHARMKYADPSKFRPFNERENAASYCLFGEHLTALPETRMATVNVVESEKTALLCAIAYGGMISNIWTACAGMGNLTNKNDILRPLINHGRRIVLYPDRDGIQRWQQAAQQIGYKNLTINTEFITKWWKPCDGEKADIADVLLRIMREHAENSGKPDLTRRVLEAFPQARTLIEKLDCEVIATNII